MRRSGRTFRAMLQCMLAASEGKKVCYLTENSGAAYRVWIDAVKLITAYIPEPDLKFSAAKITFPSGGYIIFRSNDQERPESIDLTVEDWF